jgi:hypothetical protein
VDGDEVRLKSPKQLLAQLFDFLTRAIVGVVSFFMNRFRKLGFIDYNGDLKVHSSLLNVVLYDKPQLRREQN